MSERERGREAERERGGRGGLRVKERVNELRSNDVELYTED